MLNFIALPRSAVLVNIVILHFLQVTLLLMFQLVTFIILLNEIFLYSSAPLTPMAAPRPLAGGRYEMNSSLIRNNNNKNTHAALRSLTSASPTAATSSAARLWALRPRPRAADRRCRAGSGPLPPSPTLPTLRLPPTPSHPQVSIPPTACVWLAGGPLRCPCHHCSPSLGLCPLFLRLFSVPASSASRLPSRFPLRQLLSFPPFYLPRFQSLHPALLFPFSEA